MLKLHNVTISVQDLNTVLGVFLQGAKEDVERVYYSFWNHGATSGELEWWNEDEQKGCALFWVHGNGDADMAHDRLFWAMADAALFEILNSEHTKGTNPMPRAMEIAEQRLAQMDRVRWYVPTATDVEIFMMGNSVKAEKPVGDFTDVLAGCLESGELERPEAEPEPSLADNKNVLKNKVDCIADTASEEALEATQGIASYAQRYISKGKIGAEHSRREYKESLVK